MSWGKKAAVVILVILVLLGLKYLYDFFRPPDRGIEVWTRYLSAREIESLFTGFAYVALLKFYDRKGEIVPLEPKIQTVKKSKIEGYCYRLYELGLGFPSLSSALAQYKSSEEEPLQPEILSVNTIEARASTQRKGQLACDSIDVDVENRRKLLLGQMKDDKQWDWQEASATARIHELVALHPEILETVEVLAVDFAGQSSDAETVQVPRWVGGQLEQHTLTFRQSRPIRFKMPEEPLVTSVSQLAKLELTFSTVGLFNSKRRIFLLWSAQDFYIRKDVSRVTYGSSLSSVSRGESRTWWKPGTWFEPNRIVIKMERPRQIAIDRRIDTLVATPKFQFDSSKHKDKSIEDFMREDLETILASFEERAVAETERLMRFVLSQLGRDSDLEIEIDFS